MPQPHGKQVPTWGLIPLVFRSAYSYAERVGGVVDSQDFRFLVTAADIDGSTFETIKSGDILIVDGANLYSVIEAQAVRPGSVVIFYDLRVRA